MTRLTEQIAPWIEEALEAHPEIVSAWDLTVTPSPQGPIIALLVWVPGAVLGTSTSAVVGTQAHPGLGPDEAQQMVTNAIEACVAQRSTELAALDEHRNGTSPPAP